MKRARALRVTRALISALALASLPLVLVSSDDEPASLNLPPFEKELYLSVTAKWAPDDCVDVTVVTNLPEGTVFVIGAQPRAKPGTLYPWQPVDQVFAWTKMVPIAVTASRVDVSNLFCGFVEARRRGGKQDTNGLLLAASISYASFWGFPPGQIEKQALRIGRYGALLRGPLVRPHVIDGEHRRDAESKTFILEPLPMLPEDEENEEEVEDE